MSGLGGGRGEKLQAQRDKKQSRHSELASSAFGYRRAAEASGAAISDGDALQSEADAKLAKAQSFDVNHARTVGSVKGSGRRASATRKAAEKENAKYRRDHPAIVDKNASPSLSSSAILTG